MYTRLLVPREEEMPEDKYLTGRNGLRTRRMRGIRRFRIGFSKEIEPNIMESEGLLFTAYKEIDIRR
jgi:hypothetical protein